MEIKKDLYFVGHAHLDPAWVWDWKEGSAEAKATIRSALDRIKEYPDFKFIFPTALVYTWIEDFDPEMFREIQQRVDEGRLIPVGGSFVEPDENIAGGEGLTRQYLYAQRYFKQKFGKTAEFGFNPDGFGHSEMMPQILKKSGIKNYMFMRPEPWNLEKDIDSNVFRWVSPDGSEILGCRLVGYGNAWNFFIADVPSMGYATYYISNMDGEQPKTELKAEKDSLENSKLKVTFDMWSGQLKSLYDKVNGRELFSSNGAVPIVVDEFNADTWGNDVNAGNWNDVFRYNNVIGSFSDAKVTLIEKGPVRATIRVESFYGRSKLTQYFSLCDGGDSLDVRTRIDWQEKHKMLKLCFPISADNGEAFYEVPFGVVSRPGDGLEVPLQQWMAIKDGENGVAVINDCKYGASADGSTLKMTVCRSPIYNDQNRNRLDPDAIFTDQGVQEFNYCIMPFKGEWVDVKRRAALLNCGPTSIIENNHNGILPESLSGIECNSDNVIISALKNSEDGQGTILRITEFCGQDTDISLSGKLLPVPLKVSIGKWSTDTYYLPNGESSWRKVLLTEYDITE